MRVINQKFLSRGAVLVDVGFDGDGSSLEVADYIGIVCAYLSKGRPVSEMQHQLAEVLNPDIGARARQTFDLFEDWKGRGLWKQGPAEEDISFTDSKLAWLYPCVGLELEAKRAADAAHDRQYQF